ncbi:replication initiation protein RepC [Acetobacter persici]|uniref:replication initiation protein RepC n=1 Tax=Acetobacter persici TaxID=1076596 RepID=UPI0020117CAF|nr:replication initiation protein RepC [Acetobacter persici]
MKRKQFSAGDDLFCAYRTALKGAVMRVWKTEETEAAAKSGRRKLSHDAKVMRGKITQARHYTSGHFPAVTRAKILAVWTEASYYFPLSDKAVRYLTFMLQETEANDWSGRWVPVFGRSNADMSEILGVGVTQLKALARELIDAGLILPHGEGRRYVRRDYRDGGRITNAVGFDLSPIALRVDELISVAKERRALERSIKRLRRDARREGAECLALCEDAPETQEIRDLMDIARSARDPSAIQAALSRLQAKRLKMEEALAEAFGEETDPERSVSRPSIIPTTPLCLHKTVATKRNPCGVSLSAASDDATQRAKEEEGPSPSLSDAQEHSLEDDIRSARITPMELFRTVQEFAWVAETMGWKDFRSWRSAFDVAEKLSHSLGISRDAWGQGCAVLGVKGIVVAVALIASRTDQHFVASKGGYFRGMVRAAEEGKLNLLPSIYAMRERLSSTVH